jgi:hypothetical protein
LATAPDYWHVYPVAYSPLSANPYSTGRLAVVPVAGGKSDLGMFYAASDLPGALWEVLLRHVAPDDQRHVHIDVAKLAGMRAVRLRLRHAAPVLELGQPGLRVLFPINSPESIAVAALLAEPDTRATHARARCAKTSCVSA